MTTDELIERLRHDAIYWAAKVVAARAWMAAYDDDETREALAAEAELWENRYFAQLAGRFVGAREWDRIYRDLDSTLDAVILGDPECNRLMRQNRLYMKPRDE